MSLSKVILILLVAGFIGHIFYYYPNLPEQMATHFNAKGEADSWMSKSGFVLFESALLFLIVAKFTFLPFLMAKLPNSLVNLPNKDYWLSEEKKAETFSIISQYFDWFSIGLLSLFIVINDLVFRANINKQNLSDFIWIPLVVFLIFVGIWTIRLILRFKKTK